MIQVTIHQHDTWNDDVFEFCSKMLKSEKTTVEKIKLLFDYYAVLNNKLDFPTDQYHIQEVNNCYLIYRELEHLLTIKFEL